MKDKINIAELLKDCPSGMELDCPMYENVTLFRVSTEVDYPIKINTENGFSTRLTKYGQNVAIEDAKCVIFPKGKTTWEGFVPPCKFKDGDIVYVKSNEKNEYIIIFKEIKNNHIHKYACFAYQHLSIDKCALCHLVDAEIMRIATEEEKRKLFQAIKDNGYKWNSETKTLEKLIEPKFKMGDRIKHRLTGDVHVVLSVISNGYGGGVYDVAVTNEIGKSIDIADQDEWELVPDKFDITTLVPLESKVLVRDCNQYEWEGEIFTRYTKTFDNCNFVTLGGQSWKQCIPYNDSTKHLLGTTNDCDEYYKTWEK